MVRGYCYNCRDQQKKGKDAAERINSELGKELICFIKTDISSQSKINKLAKKILRRFNKVDIIINNAAVAPLGAVKDSILKDWDKSYQVNLRGPVLLARKFLPAMLKHDYGVFVCVSSEGLAYMGPYETMKSAQLHLARTIDAELGESGVISFAIGPGFVPTETAEDAVNKLANLYGKSYEELQAMYKDHIVSVEAAGAALAAAVVLASSFRGQEIGAKQVLIKAGLELENNDDQQLIMTEQEIQKAKSLCIEARKTLFEQNKEWEERPLFERQWLLRDFKKNAGMAVEQWLDTLDNMIVYLNQRDLNSLKRVYKPLDQLADFYSHLQELTKSYVKDKKQLAEYLVKVRSWQTVAAELDLICNQRK
ncbi:MAG: SDR family oxidoreductase [Halanaerobiales bacterium]|nr:SDR family oxidoreductase [Halanaerobiales bacterium]